MLLQILSTYIPTQATWALTSGPSHPDVSGYQSADVNDNVSLSTGAFNYNIPITSIPEYPMSIGYHNGMNPDQEASAFGFGFSGFSGAVTRDMIGLPDDVKGGNTIYDWNNEKLWGLGIGVTASVDFANEAQESDNVLSITSLGGSFSMDYNNYSGFSTTMGASLGFEAYGFTGSAGMVQSSNPKEVGLDFSVADPFVGIIQYQTNFKQNGAKMTGFGAFFRNQRDALKGMVNGFTNSIERFEYPGTYNSSIAPINNVSKLNNSFGISVTVPFSVSPVDFSVTGRYYQTYNETMSITKKAMGYGYLQTYDRANEDFIADYTTEGEIYFDKQRQFTKALNNPSYIQKDNFIISAGGLGLGAQFVRDEYGEFSRYRFRSQDRNLEISVPTSVVAAAFNPPLKLKTQRKEVLKWTAASKAVINRNLDILALLKKSDNVGDKDFDNTIFVEQQLVDMNTDVQKYEHKPVLKARGDLAGDFNFSSEGYNDFGANRYTIESTGETGGERAFFLGAEYKIPVFYPMKSVKKDGEYTLGNGSKTIKRGTNIQYRTFNEIGTVSTHPSSIYQHYKYDPLAGDKDKVFYLKEPDGASSPADGREYHEYQAYNPYNALLANSNVSKDLIADITVKNGNGMTYVFNLPVFQKSATNLSLSGKTEVSSVALKNVNEAPKKNADKYYTYDRGSKKVDRNKLTVKEEYWYPYAWLLTAIVGPDYVDYDDIPGPSDGDLGYWVRFKYVKVADDYRWRNPFTGMNHSPGFIEDKGDDAYSVSTGTKEIYYLERVESKNYISQYQYAKRLDGFEANGTGDRNLVNGDAYNSTIQAQPAVDYSNLGNQALFATTEVALYKKRASYKKGFTSYNADLVRNNGNNTKLSSTRFLYDYSVSSMVPNQINTTRATKINNGQVPYHVDANSGYQTGKLTLRKVQQYAYDEQGTEVAVPPYNLSYSFDENPDLNPSFDNNSYDGWFNFSKNAKSVFENVAGKSQVGSVNAYQHFNELNKDVADVNAKLYALSSVSIPSGGKISVEMEASGYAKVQNKDAFVMRKVSALKLLADNKLEIEVDISDLLKDGKNLGNGGSIGQSLFDTQEKLYGEIAFLENNKGVLDYSDHTKITDDCYVSTFGEVLSGTKTQKIVLETRRNSEVPFFKRFYDFMYDKSFKMHALKNSLNVLNCTPLSCPSIDASSMYDDKNETPIDAIMKSINNLKNYFISDGTFECLVRECFMLKPNAAGNYTAFVPHLSYLRTPVYKEVYTGSRVKSISYSDEFAYSSNYGAVDGKHSNVYKTNYYYDSNSDGTGKSEGVATVEPVGDKSCVIQPSNFVGEGFLPAPRIIYAKTTVENGYAKRENVADANPQVVSRRKGKQVYEFYTPKDAGYSFEENFKSPTSPAMKSAIGGIGMFGILAWLQPFKDKPKWLRWIKIPIPIPITVLWNRSDNYYVKSYTYKDVTDMYGVLKSRKSLNSEGKYADKEEYIYAGTSEAVKLIDGTQSSSSTSADPYTDAARLSYAIPGRYDQTWGESFQTKESAITLTTALLIPYMYAATNRNFAYTNMKYSYVPPILKQVSAVTSEGLVSATTYDAFDYYTGQVLESTYKDSKNESKITRVVPAYWKYKELGPYDISDANSNILASSTASYQYLGNTSVPDKVLSVSATQWDYQSWGLTDIMLPRIDASGFHDGYTKYGAQELNSVFLTNGVTSRSTGVSSKLNGGWNFLNKHIGAGKFYRPSRSYLYEADKGADATFTITPFNFTGANTTWKQVGETTLYDIFGNVIETKDILGKYSAQHLGYDYEMATSSAANSKSEAFVHEGAENLYRTKSGSTTTDYLEHSGLTLNAAQIFGVATKQQADEAYTMNFTDLTATGAGSMEVEICSQISGVTANVPVARYNATFTNGATRKLLLYYDELKNPYLLTDRMEKYDAFYAFNNPTAGCLWGTKLMFSKARLTSLTLDNTFSNSNFTSSAPVFKYQITCNVASKNYVLPSLKSLVNPHTGDYCFATAGGATGLKFTVLKSSIPAAEFYRKYTAMVWVHKSSSLTKLVLQTSSTNKIEASSQSPYLEVGNWVLLRADLEAPLSTSADNKIEAYVYNAASSGLSIYDDFRVGPYQSMISASVYDQKYGRTTAILDENNFASFFYYDGRGRNIESKAEVANVGVKTVTKHLYNDQKK